MDDVVKIRKKDIKEAKRPDALLVNARSLFDWLVDNRKIALGAIGALAVVLIAVNVIKSSAESKRKTQGAVLSSAINKSAYIVADGVNDRAFPSEEAKQEAVSADFAAARDLGGKVGKSASLGLAAIALEQGDADTAIAGFQSYLAEGGSSPLRIVAIEGLAAAYEAKGEFANAREQYQKLSKLGAEGRALFNEARLAEEEGDKAKARELYQQVVKEHESESVAIDARVRLDLLSTPPAGEGAF